MNTRHVSLTMPGLTNLSIPVTAASTVEMVEHDCGTNLWYALLVDGRHYDLVMWKHTIGRDALLMAFDAAYEMVRAAIDALTPIAQATRLNDEALITWWPDYIALEREGITQTQRPANEDAFLEILSRY